MVDVVYLQSAAYIAQVVGVVGTLTAAFIGVRSYVNSNKRAEEARRRELETRQAQLFMGVYQTWATKDSQRQLEKVLAFNFKDYEDWVRKYGPVGDNPEDHSSWDFVMTYMDGLGSLVKRDLIDPRFVAELMGLPVIFVFQKFRSVILGQRIRSPLLYGNFEMLYNVVSDLVPGQSYKTLVRAPGEE
jgi:hypothetical protein